MNQKHLHTSLRDKLKEVKKSGMPNYYGFRKRPVMAKDKNGVVKMVSLKTADKLGLEIVNTMGITEKF